MILEKGNLVNDGQHDLLICSNIDYDNKQYVLLFNMETDDMGIYEVKFSNDVYDFNVVKDEKMIEILFGKAATEYMENNPEEFKNFIKLNNINIKTDKEG